MNLYMIARDALSLRQECIYYIAINDRTRAQECGLRALSKYLDLAESLKSQKTRVISKDIVDYYAAQAELSLEVVERIKSNKSILTQENAVVWRSSALPGGMFYPWTGNPPIHGAELLWSINTTCKKDIFSENVTRLLHLSMRQMSLISGWKHLHELNPDPNMWPEEYDFLQGASMDCPLVASLIICLNYERLQGKRLVTNTLYPQDSNGSSVLSPTGFYDIKLFFNGRARLVTIDDRLPLLDLERSGGRTLYVLSESKPCRFGAALIEKAFLNVTGEGYDFGGSNITTATYALCGFIPEIVLLQSSLRYLESLWSPLFEAWKNGHALIGAGTGKHVEMGLTAEHDYAVVAMKEKEDGAKMALFMDPAKGFEDSPNRLKWFNLSDIGRYFSCLYVNWNPVMFSSSRACHFELTPANMRGFHCLESTQFIVRSKSHNKSEIWFLLVRHLTENVSSPGKEVAIGICFHKSSHSILECRRPVLDPVFMNTQQILAKLPVEPDTDYIVVPVVRRSNGLKSQVRMSLFTFSRDQDFSLDRASPLFGYSLKLTDRLARHSFSPSDWLASSQQFGLELDKTSKLAVILNCDEDDVHSDDSGLVQLNLAWAQSFSPKGKVNRIQTLPSKSLIMSSGDYRLGHCVMSTEAHQTGLEVGKYVIIVSRFHRERQHEVTDVRFSLTIYADNCKPVVEPLTDYASARFSKEITSAWRARESERRFKLKIDRRTIITISAATEPFAGEDIEVSLISINDMQIVAEARQPSGMRCTLNDVVLRPTISTQYIIACKRATKMCTEACHSFLLAVHSEEPLQIEQEM